MCYNTKYVGYDKNEENRSVYYLWGGGNTASKLRAGCVPRMRRDKKRYA